ncbi:uncharacterized protein [Euphorbia lathyris]|uniref:uncharacterized protein n=1 Tax=Euphorbia lathyris TaxID=212925 RepID=UPI0033141C28
MDNGGGGCCIARYGGSGAGYDSSTIDRIMMKFRPIAPKPVNGTSSSPEMSETSSTSGRGKRRRCNNGNNNRKRKAVAVEAAAGAVTLPLLPETPDRKESPAREMTDSPTWLSLGRKELDRTVAMPQVLTVVIGSCVTVECVTDTWVDVDELGCTDSERRMNLERVRCPGFISDGYGRVTWMNEAYKEMARGGGGGGGGEVVVWLVMKDKAAATAALASNQAFSCRVRVQNQKSSGNGKEKSSITLPCDVWRFDGGGYAWRLDVTAALSLGRLPVDDVASSERCRSMCLGNPLSLFP